MSGNVIAFAPRAASRTKDHELYVAFAGWARGRKGYAESTIYRYYLMALHAQGWMLERHGSLVGATPRDLQAFLFSLPATAGARNLARQALVALFDFLIDQDAADVNIARLLPVVPSHG